MHLGVWFTQHTKIYSPGLKRKWVGMGWAEFCDHLNLFLSHIKVKLMVKDIVGKCAKKRPLLGEHWHTWFQGNKIFEHPVRCGGVDADGGCHC